MKYTKDDLAKMSDFEINKSLAEIVGDLDEIPYGLEEFNLGDKVAYYDSMRSIHKCNAGYCEDWDAIMPLAVEHGIHFGPDGDIDNPTNHYAISDKSISSENLIEVVHSVPQRAIACCLILVLQERE